MSDFPELIINFHGILLTKKQRILILDLGGTDATGHPSEREINNPELWKNEEWVKDVWDKLETFEKMLDS